MDKERKSLKLQVTFSASLYAKIEALAEELSISKSAAVSVMVSQGFQAREGLNAVAELMEVYKLEKAKQEETV